MTQIRPVTAEDVAKRAGVSRTAVSQALRGQGRISPSVVNRVRALAEEMNYRPRVAAQMLRGKNLGQIGLLLDRVAESSKGSVVGFHSPYVEAFVERCDEDGQRYFIEYATPGEWNSRSSLPRQFAGQLVDGTILLGHIGCEIHDRLDEGELSRCVTVEEQVCRCVRTNDEAGMFSAVRSLVAMGHRSIAFASGPTRYSVHRFAKEGYARAVREFGLATAEGDRCCVEFGNGGTANSAMDFMLWARELLALDNHPTAVVCTSHRIARTLLYVAASRGISVPGRLSVIAHGPSSVMESEYPRISAIEPNHSRVMRLALNKLQALVQGDDPGRLEDLVDPAIEFRDTTAPTELR